MAFYEEIIDRAEQLAFGVGNIKQTADASITAQTIFPHAVRSVLNRLAATGDDVQDLMRLHEIQIQKGFGKLPVGVLKDTLDMAIFPGRPFVSFVPYHDFLRYKFLPQMDYYAVNGDCFHFATNGDAGCCGVKILMSAPTVPDLTDIDNELPLSNKVVEETILTIAAVLRGEQTVAGLVN